MNPRVKAVSANKDFTINLLFDNGEKGVFDVKPYLDIGVFKELSKPENFTTVKAFMGSIQWQHGQDLCPDTLYLGSIKES